MTDAISTMPAATAKPLDRIARETAENVAGVDQPVAQFGEALDAALEAALGAAGGAIVPAVAIPDPSAASAVLPASAHASAEAPGRDAGSELDELTEIAITGGVPLPILPPTPMPAAPSDAAEDHAPDAAPGAARLARPGSGGARATRGGFPAALAAGGPEAAAASANPGETRALPIAGAIDVPDDAHAGAGDAAADAPPAVRPAEDGGEPRPQRTGVAGSASAVAQSFDAVLERLGANPKVAATAETAGPPAAMPADAAAVGPRGDAPAPLHLDTRLPVHGPRFADGVGQQIVVLAQHGIHEARMTLSPPEIGPVDVRISVASDEASVQIAAPTAAARDAIQDALPRLREMMEQSGLRLQDAGVFAQLPQRDQSNPGGRPRDEALAPPVAPQSFADDADTSPVVVRRLGLVDAYA